MIEIWLLFNLAGTKTASAPTDLEQDQDNTVLITTEDLLSKTPRKLQASFEMSPHSAYSSLFKSTIIHFTECQDIMSSLQ